MLIDWNPRYLYRRLFDGDEAAVERFLQEVCTPDWNVEQDAGRSCADAIAERSALFPHHAEMIRAYYEQWPEMLVGPIEETVAVLADLKEAAVPVYALTNWSRETFPHARDRFEFLDWFDGIVVSGEEGLAKPDPALYRQLRDRFDVDLEQAVFIDDNQANVETARSMGMLGIHFHNAMALRQELGHLGVPGSGGKS